MWWGPCRPTPCVGSHRFAERGRWPTPPLRQQCRNRRSLPRSWRTSKTLSPHGALSAHDLITTTTALDQVDAEAQLDLRNGRLAQLVRAAGLQPAGRGFESLSAHHDPLTQTIAKKG